jgi:hypothetical protein
MKNHKPLRRLRRSFTLAAASIAAGLTAHAAPITVQNHSFESPGTTGYIGVGQFAGGNSLVNHGWNISGANTYLINKNSSITASNVTGNQFLLFEPFADGDVMVYQNTGATFAAGTYTLTVDIGMATGFADYGENATAEFQLLSFNGSYNYNVGAAATSVSVKNHNGSLATYTYTLTLNGSENFIGDEIAILLKGNQNGSTNQNVSYDNVRLDFVELPPAPPVISTQPGNQSVLEGCVATLSVTATGADLTYQWKKDDVDIDGAVDSTYTIPSAQSSDAGSYTVVVSNNDGDVTSSAATLTVNAPGLPLPVAHSSFEKPVTADYTIVGAGLTGWNIDGPNTYVVKSGQLTTINGVTGDQSLFLEPWADGSSKVWQNTGAILSTGTYNLLVDIGQSSGFATSTGNGDAAIKLFAFDGTNYTPLATTTVSSSTMWGHFGDYRTYSVSLNAAGNEPWIGQTLVIELGASATVNGASQNVSMDNVRLYGPQPSSTPLASVFNQAFTGTSSAPMGAPWVNDDGSLDPTWGDQRVNLAQSGIINRTSSYIDGVVDTRMGFASSVPLNSYITGGTGAGAKYRATLNLDYTEGQFVGLAIGTSTDLWNLMGKASILSDVSIFRPDAQYVVTGSPLSPEANRTLAVEVDNTGSKTIIRYFQDDAQVAAYTATGILTFTRAAIVSWDNTGATPATLSADINSFEITSANTGTGSAYESWATVRAGGQAADLDYDNDGVANGVEFFMNAATGFTANPGLVGNTVTWANGGNIPSSDYGSKFVVQTSTDLVNWSDVPASGDANLVNTSGSVAYTLTGPGKKFARLKVTP